MTNTNTPSSSPYSNFIPTLFSSFPLFIFILILTLFIFMLSHQLNLYPHPHYNSSLLSPNIHLILTYWSLPSYTLILIFTLIYSYSQTPTHSIPFPYLLTSSFQYHYTPLFTTQPQPWSQTLILTLILNPSNSHLYTFILTQTLILTSPSPFYLTYTQTLIFTLKSSNSYPCTPTP